MIEVQEILESIKNFLSERKVKTLVVCLVLVFMTLCALVVLAFQTPSKSDKKKRGKHSPEQRTLVLETPIFIPEGPAVPNEYITSNKSGEKWSENQIDEWFTFPNEAEISRLDSFNSGIVNDIIEAAP